MPISEAPVLVVIPARNFVQRLQLPDIVRRRAAPPPIRYTPDSKEAFVVGSQVNAFAPRVHSEFRQDINNCTLLAQLAANKKMTARNQIYDWYNDYFEVLYNVGWTLTQNDFLMHQTSDVDADVHEAILAVAQSFLGAAPAALAVVISVVEALAKMDESSPWITLFNQQSQKMTNASFQIAVAEENGQGEAGISLLAFGVEAEQEITQVLFFKFKQASATLRQCAGKVTINNQVLVGVRKMIADKVAAYTDDYVSRIAI